MISLRPRPLWRSPEYVDGVQIESLRGDQS